mmetsp:Transcript_42415/g.76159  ORF Transcript_42415/g.76159 Transcript_42415/m.76159 type:complete len:82 (-) Transcript_42415:1412-1657(-)
MATEDLNERAIRLCGGARIAGVGGSSSADDSVGGRSLDEFFDRPDFAEVFDAFREDDTLGDRLTDRSEFVDLLDCLLADRL